MRYFAILILICFCSACKKSLQPEVTHKPENEDNQVFYTFDSFSNIDSYFFPDFHSGDTLHLDVRLDDCGEWGGPQEKLKMSMNDNRQFVLNYKHYRFNCDSISKYYSMKNRPLDFEKTIVMDNPMKVALSGFIKATTQAKIFENLDSNAGSVFHIHTADSTLNIYVYSTDYRIANDFIRFKQELGLPAKRQKPESK